MILSWLGFPEGGEWIHFLFFVIILIDGYWKIKIFIWLKEELLCMQMCLQPNAWSHVHDFMKKLLEDPSRDGLSVTCIGQRKI
jgi:hypothetical protein